MKTRFALLALGLCALASAQTRPPVTYDAEAIRKLAARMNAMTSGGWQLGVGLGNEMAELPSPLGYQIMRDNWTKGASVEIRKQMFKGFVFNNHPDTLLVLNLGMNDPSLSMQKWTMQYLKDIAYRDFGADFAAYPAWFERHKAQTVAQAKAESLREALESVANAKDEDLDTRAGGVAGSYQGAPVKDYPGLARMVERLVDAPTAGPASRRLALAVLGSGSLDAATNTRLALRLLEHKPDGPYNDWGPLVRLGAPPVTDRLLAMAREAKGEEVYGLASALVESEDSRVVPSLMGLFDVYGPEDQAMLSRTLASAFGGSSEKPPTAAWWKGWYAANRARFEMKYDESKLPSFKINAVAPEAYIPDADDVKAIPSRSFYVGGDRRMRYLVSGSFEKGSKKNVLVVMPGGAGTAEFHPFVKRIQKTVLDGGWIVVQPIAYAWDDEENRVVWPSVGVPYAPAKYTAETFVDGILDELGSRHGVEVGRTEMLAWSSSGPATYSYLAHGKHKIDGAFIAMSIFQPSFFGDVQKLNAGRVFLYHSPTDFIPMSNPEAGKAALESRGVKVQMLTYPGGHGWAGQTYKDLATGFAFLKGN